jgi:hypothetical protein
MHSFCAGGWNTHSVYADNAVPVERDCAGMWGFGPAALFVTVSADNWDEPTNKWSVSIVTTPTTTQSDPSTEKAASYVEPRSLVLGTVDLGGACRAGGTVI